MKHLTILMLFLWLSCGCTSEYDDNSSPEKSTFTVSDAQKYFENSNMQVADLTFSATRSVQSTLTPDWKGAKITGAGDITTVEAPLSDGELQEVLISQTARPEESPERMKTFKRLVTQRHKNGEVRQFVVTMAHAGRTRSSQDDNCYGKSNFSGYIIVSSVGGEYQDAFESDGELWTRQKVTTLDREEDLVLEFSPYGRGDDILAPEGCVYCENCCIIYNYNDNPNGCPMCNESNDPPPTSGGFIDDVVINGVRPNCTVCRYPKNQCECCMWCHRYPCRCNWWVCVKCGSRYCEGNCRPSIGGGVGSDSGSGSGGSGGSASGSRVPNNCVNTDNEKVLKILDKLNEDCMGKTLFSKLQDRKIPVKIIAGTGAKYIGQVESGSVVEAIYLGSDSPDMAFLEELIHAYQLTKATPGNYFQLNTEIEAKLGWVMYVQRKGGNVSDYKKYLGLDSGVMAFERLCQIQTSGISLYKEENLPLYRDTYNDIVNLFRTLDSAYKNPDKYPFSKDHMYFKNIGELMANC